MDHIAQKDTALQVDVENGGLVHEDSGDSPVSGVKQQAKILLAKLYGNVPSVENVATTVGTKLEANKGRDVEEKKVIKQKPKPLSAKKPPRPPKAPSLDAADQKLIREITELAKLKRARIERMKALRKMKATKAPSSNSNALAFLFTIIFGLLIIFQGMQSRGRSGNFHGSHVPAGAADGSNLASAQFLCNPPVAARDLNGPISSSPNSLEQVAGLDPQQKLMYSG